MKELLNEIINHAGLIFAKINKRISAAFNEKQLLKSRKKKSIRKGKRKIKNLSLFFIKLVYSIGNSSLFNQIKELLTFKVKNGFNHKKKNKKRAYEATFFYKLRFFLFGSLFSFLFLFLPILTIIFASQLPNPYNLSINSIPKTTKIYDRNGNLLYEIYANQNRTIAKLSDISPYLINATIATEDKDFYNHPGFDLKGIARAAWNNFQHRDIQGGSTITQQLIKSAFFSPQPTVARKIKEIALAFLAERIYSKNKILEFYFNYVPYGGTAWGAQAASEIYFGKDVKELTLAESAFLAGVPKAPSIYSPYNGEKLWKKRQKEVLDAMARDGYISGKQAQEAYAQELFFNDPHVPIRAPHFVMYIKDYLVKKYGLTEVERGGLKVITSLDLNTQEMAEEIVREEVENDGYLNIKNGASLITDPKTGDILAMVGNHNYFDSDNSGNVNITTSLRQPGSAIKIITYSLALKSGFTEATILDDSPLVVQSAEGPYIPVNYDGLFHGRIPLRLAFANSLNIPAVRVAQRLGVENIINFGKDMGINSWSNSNKYGLSITLGAVETTMFDLARAYGTVANKGTKVEIDPILEISDSQGNVIYKKTPREKRILNPEVSFIISDILADNRARSMEFGPNSPLKIDGHRVSVKTGTSDYKKDNWTAGFTKDYVVITWVGNHDNSPMSQALASGITGAAPIWNKIFVNLLKDKQDDLLQIPQNIIKKSCYGYDSYFVKGTENTVNCGSALYITPTPTISPSPSPSSFTENWREILRKRGIIIE